MRRQQWIDEGRGVDIVCLDFRKTIDTVSHNDAWAGSAESEVD